MAAGTRLATLIAAGLAVGALAACSEDEPEPLADPGGELIRIEPTVVTTAPASTPATPVPSTAPVDPMAGCLDWYRFKIEAGDETVVAFWQNQLGEDLVQLVAECERLVADEPARVQEMIEEQRRIDEFLRAATATTAPA